MANSNLYEKTYYTAPYSYLRSTFIREYDLSKANISVLLQKGIITQSQFDWYASIPKINRQILIGKMQPLEEYDNLLPVQIISDGVKEARQLFILHNAIEDIDILSIKNDALYIISKIPTVLDFGNYHFIMKNIYTSYYKLTAPKQLEIYYYLDRFNNIEKLDIKGISEESLTLHENFMVDFLKTLFYTIETGPLGEALNLIQAFYGSYVNRELDLGYYRQFGAENGFDTNMRTPIMNQRYIIRTATIDKSIVNIDYNAVLIMELYKIVSSMYFNETKR